MTLRLELASPDRLALDQPLVAVARLRNDGPEPVLTSARLNLHEGDLLLSVTRPDGTTGQVVWAWPIDSALRRIELGPGAVLESGVLVHWAVGDLVMPIAGRYRLAASFTATPDVLVEAAPVDVLRTDATDEDGLAAQRLVGEPDVARSLAVAGPLGTAAQALGVLARRGPPSTRLLATLALADADLARAVTADLAAADGPVAPAAVATAVLPAGLYPGDERVTWVGEALPAGPEADAADVDRARSVLSGSPHPQR